MIWKNICCLLLLPVMLSSCSLPVDTDLAELAVADFHDRYNRAAFKAIHKAANPDFKKFISQDKFSLLLGRLHSGLGQHKSSSLANWTAENSIREGATITLTYDAIYEKDDTVRESFTFKVKDGIARLYNFNVSSEVLSKNRNSKATKS